MRSGHVLTPDVGGGLPAKATNPPAKSNWNALPFREVYEAYFRFARRTLRRLGVRDADLLDMTQNVFVVVHRKLPRFEGRSKLTTWLYGICRRIATDYLRSARIRRDVLVDYHGIESLSRRSVATYASDRSSIVAFVKSALDRLPEDQRIVFLLFTDEDVRAEDIAALLDIPEGTVRSRLRRARETLRHEAARLKRIGMGPLLTPTLRNWRDGSASRPSS